MSIIDPNKLLNIVSFKLIISIALLLYSHGGNATIADNDTASLTPPELLETKPSVGSGYNKLSNTYVPSCFEQVSTTSPTEIKQSLITFQDDMKEESLRNVLDLELALKIPIQGIITINPKFIFSRDASVTNLSHSTTYIAHSILGDKKLDPYQENRLVLKPQFRRYFDSNGNLTNAYEFIRLCGDEIVSSQQLGSKLIITTKISFKSASDKLFFEADIGISPSIISSWEIQAKIKDLDIKFRQRLRMTFYAIQIGGQPERLIGALKTDSCVLDNIENCQNILDRLHNYAADDYSNQLVATKTDRWDIENLETLPYYLTDIYDEQGQKLSFDIISNPYILDKLDKIKLAGQDYSIKEQSNLKVAEMMKETKYLATDEKETLNEITTTAQENLQKLKFFGNECYRTLNQCLEIDIDKTFSNIITPYDTSLLGVNLGVLISKVYAYTKSNFFWDNRVSEDFVILQPELQEGFYSSYYLKFKNFYNYVIKNNKVTVDIRCNNSYWFSNLLIDRAFQYYEVLQPQMAINYKQKCNNETALFVASPIGFYELMSPDTPFIVELWGRT